MHLAELYFGKEKKIVNQKLKKKLSIMQATYLQ